MDMPVYFYKGLQFKICELYQFPSFNGGNTATFGEKYPVEWQETYLFIGSTEV
jgi:hypothetical protein